MHSLTTERGRAARAASGLRFLAVGASLVALILGLAQPDFPAAQQPLFPGADEQALAQEAIVHHQFDEAIADYRKALLRSPNDASLHIGLGIALIGKGNLQEAIGEFRTAARLDPRNGLARLDLGMALLRSGKPQDAVAALGSAAALIPSSPQAHYQLGLG